MSALVKRKQLVLAGLVVALGTAMFVNWYFTKPTTNIGGKIASESTTQSDVNLGDAQYVNGTAQNSENDYFASALLNRNNAHDKAQASLKEIIESSEARDEDKAEATNQINELAKNIQLEADIENLVKAKVSGDCIVTLSDSAEVVVGSGKLNDSVVTQIKEIIVNKTKISQEKIIIIEAK